MSIAKKLELLSVDKYLKLEARSEVRHEFVEGHIFAMVGGSEKHNLICLAIATEIRAHLRDKPCRVFMSDMKLMTKRSVYYYPDVMVVCNQSKPASVFQTEPILLVEVLSESTEAKDRLEKLVTYQGIPSLSEYLLVSQNKVCVEIYRKVGDDWEIEELNFGDTVLLKSVNFEAPIERFYEDVVGLL